MAVPNFNHHGVLPPFHGSPATMSSQSPFAVSFPDVVDVLGTSTERLEILSGFLRYRDDLLAAGVQIAQHWLDGSFVEDKEGDPNRGTPPGDVDVVTFVTHAPKTLPAGLIGPAAKSNYKVDAYFIDLRSSPLQLVRETTYWLQLFSHSRVDALWKGMLLLDGSLDHTLCEKAIRERAKKLRQTSGGAP